MPNGSLLLPTLSNLFHMNFVFPVFILGAIFAFLCKLIRGGAR